jgi:hypothetical protein
MQCIIHSKVRSTNKLWKRLNGSSVVPESDKNKNYDIDSLINDISQISIDQINQGYGLLFNFDGYKCIITCSHIVGKANMRIDVSLKDNKGMLRNESCKIVSFFEEYDIAILEFVNKKNAKKYSYYNYDEIHNLIKLKDISEIPNTYIIKHLSIEGIMNQKIIEHDIKVNEIKIESTYIKSTLAPKIPMIVVEIGIRDRPIDLHGLSGAPLLNSDGIPIGIISNGTDSIYCIPMSVICKFIHELKSGQEHKLSSILLGTNVVESTYSHKKITCHQITNAFELSYDGKGKKKFKFKDCDIIYKINDIGFEEDGTIYNNDIGYPLELYTYFMFESLQNKIIKLEMFRMNDSGEYKETSQYLHAKSIESLYNIYMCDTNNYYRWKNYLFTEVSEELIGELLSENLISATFLENKTMKDENGKLVIMISDKSVNLIEKIGNKKINSLNDIKKILISNEKIVFTCKRNEIITKIVI